MQLINHLLLLELFLLDHNLLLLNLFASGFPLLGETNFFVAVGFVGVLFGVESAVGDGKFGFDTHS